MMSAMPKATTKARPTLLPMETASYQPTREEDLTAWLLDQANELRTRTPASIDWAGIAEELEEIAASTRHALVSDLVVVLRHLLKLQYETSANEWRGRSRGWKLHAAEHRDRVIDFLDESKSLLNRFDEFVRKAYPRARQQTALETGHKESRYPETCPWSVEQILDPKFFPETFKS